VQNISLIKQIMALPSTVVTTGSTFENRENLSASFIETILQRYQNTRLGQQELYAKILDDVPGALWQRENIETYRVEKATNMTRIVVALDPAATNTEDSDETGIIVAGKGVDGKGYLLADNTVKASPKGWGTTAINLYESWKADRVIAEVNNGGEMVEHVLRSINPNVPYKAIHASRGKRVRAEPISAMYEQGKIHHVGMFPQLEDQMCSFTPESTDSPDRVDALVWAFTDLFSGDDWSGSFQVMER
jgi:predicted phage terminase large subunit-like protein